MKSISPAQSLRFRGTSKNNLVQKNQITWETAFKVFAAIFSLAGVILTLIGYGTVLGIADLFGLDATDIYHSPIDFLFASKDFIVCIFNAVNMHKENVNFGDDSMLLDGYILAITFVIIYALAKFTIHLSKKKISIRLRVKQFITYTEKYHLDYPLVAVGSFFVSYLFHILSVFVFITMILVVATLPTLGYFAGTYVAREEIFKPTRCQSNRPILEGLNKAVHGGAICLRVVTKDGKEIAHGRRILRTSDQLFLYDKKNHKTKSVPLRDLIVEQTDVE